ncbi:MAG: hypothetical protein QXU67_04230 [Candidatus Bathyarchaeia archaeon]
MSEDSTVHLIWVGNYADKLFSSGKSKRHYFDVIPYQFCELKVEYIASFEMGPFGGGTRGGHFSNI